MNTNTNVVRLRQPDEIDDPLTDVLRAGARRLLAQAVELEAEAFLAGMRDVTLPDGRARLVRHGHGPECDTRPGSDGSGVAGEGPGSRRTECGRANPLLIVDLAEVGEAYP